MRFDIYIRNILSKIFNRKTSDIEKLMNVGLEILLSELISKSWKKTTEFDLILKPTAIPAGDYEQLVSVMLKHISKVASRLDVPLLIPRVEIKNLPFAGGHFIVDENGWVRIEISSKYASDIKLMRSIMSHEICHYVLNHNGIRKKDTLENEKMTDVAMFVFGLGLIYLDGVKLQEGILTKDNHKLSYLADNEYIYLQKRAKELWNLPVNLNAIDPDLEATFKTAIKDSRARDRLLNNERSKFPKRNDNEHIKNILESFYRDRGR
jgi:hypothetical protein